MHVVVHMDPGLAASWSDAEVAERWVQLFPAMRFGAVDPEGCRRKVLAIVATPERVLKYRTRLGSLSWFMRCLSEPIARSANREDGCTGRFWEGRFKCQVLLDDAAVLACMAYVDLNPVRAGIASDLRTSHHTSIHRRMQTQPRGSDAASADGPIVAVAGPLRAGFLPISERAYIRLVDWTGRQLHPGKRGVIAEAAPTPLPGGLDEADWTRQVEGWPLTREKSDNLL